MARRTGFVWHEKFAWWDLGQEAGLFHPDGFSIQPDRHVYDLEIVRRFRNLLDVSGLLDQLTTVQARTATDQEIGRVHPTDFIEDVKRLSELPMGGESGESAPVPRGGFTIAALAAGGAIAAAEAVMEGQVDNAYALLRPAGHHARPDQSMGSCILSNASIAARHLLEACGAQRVAVIDWDVHHGNGTQAALYDEPRALTVSVHQDRLYPADDGFVDQVGAAGAEGTNLNVPLPPGCGTEAYDDVFERVVLPAMRRFRPDIMIVACGFDAGHMDPLGRMMLTSQDYRNLTRKMVGLADELCGGKILFTHEGGYSRWAVPFYGLAVLEELSGISTGVDDPFMLYNALDLGHGLLPHQESAVDAAAKNVDRVPVPATDA